MLEDLLGHEDRILEVVALPRHERDEQVGAQGQFSGHGGRPVCNDLTGLHALPDSDHWALIDARVLVRSLELPQRVLVHGLRAVQRVAVADADTAGIDFFHHAAVHCGRDGPGIDRDAVLDTGAHERRLRLDERHGLPLHVRAHQRSVGVIVLQEGNESRGGGYQLLRGNIHVLDVLARHRREIIPVPGQAGCPRAPPSGNHPCAWPGASHPGSSQWSRAAHRPGR